MFENSQEEKDTGAVKVIGGVIAVVVVLLVVVYFAFLRGGPATQGGNAAPAGASAAASAEAPDPAKDLAIVHFDLHRDQTQTQAVWDIEVANRSKVHGYKNIKFATNYYNGQDQVIYHNEGTVNDAVDAADQHTYSLNDGLYPVGTSRYTIEIKGADAAN